MKNTLNKNQTSTFFTLSSSENLAHLVQPFECENSNIELIKCLENLKGNACQAGYSFEDLTARAIAYFYTSIFGSLKNDNFIPHGHNGYDDYSIEKVKGYLDACNHTNFIPTKTLVTECKQLHNAYFYEEVWLIIQTAYFYATSFGHHQMLDYLDHYITTGVRLNSDDYLYDVSYLEKKYNEIDTDQTNKKHFQTKNTYLANWFYSTQEIILNKCEITNLNFKQQKKGDARLYNSLSMCPRTLRVEQPFLIVGFDISSAYPSFIDEVVGSCLGGGIYDNLARSKNITRTDAKKMFNKALNSGKYRTTIGMRNSYYSMLIDCGYTPKQCLKIIYEITDNANLSFFEFGSTLENKYINIFKKENNLTCIRLHDAIYMLYDYSFDYSKLNVAYNNVKFNFEKLNEFQDDNTKFMRCKKRPIYDSLQFAPPQSNGFNFLHFKEISPLNNPIGVFKGDYTHTYNNNNRQFPVTEHIDVTYYDEPMEYYSCNFRYNAVNSTADSVKNILSYSSLFEAFCTAFKTFIWLNKTHINPNFVVSEHLIYIILKRYRKYTPLCFSIDVMASDIKMYIDEWVHEGGAYCPDLKVRDYIINSNLKIKNSFVFLLGVQHGRCIADSNYRINYVFDKLALDVSKNRFEYFKKPRRCDEEVRAYFDFINEYWYGGVRVSKIQSNDLENHPIYKMPYIGWSSNSIDQIANLPKQIKINLTRNVKTYENNIFKLGEQTKKRNIIKEFILHINPAAQINYETNPDRKIEMLTILTKFNPILEILNSVSHIADDDIKYKQLSIQENEKRNPAINNHRQHNISIYDDIKWEDSVLFDPKKLPTIKETKKERYWIEHTHHYTLRKILMTWGLWDEAKTILLKGGDISHLLRKYSMSS